MAKMLNRDEEYALLAYADKVMGMWNPDDPSTNWYYKAGRALKQQARNTWRNTRPQPRTAPFSETALRQIRSF